MGIWHLKKIISPYCRQSHLKQFFQLCEHLFEYISTQFLHTSVPPHLSEIDYLFLYLVRLQAFGTI
jgi:hypothetical protein